MNRREFLLASAGLAGGLLAGCRLPFLSRRRRYNVILILADALRADHVGCCGSSFALTPRADEFARRGTVFSDAMSSAPLTGAAIASLMTGVYQTRHGVATTSGNLAPDVPTLAELCQTAGYETAAFVGNPVLKPIHLVGIASGFDI